MRQPSFNMGDVDLRGGMPPQDVDFRNNRPVDYDMRQNNVETADEDYRVPYDRDQDFRGSGRYDDEDYEEDYDNYDENWHRGNNFSQYPANRNANNANNFNPNFQNFRNQSPGFGGQFRPPDEFWGGGQDGFRRGGRGGTPGRTPRGGRGGRIGRPPRGGPGGRGAPRGGPRSGRNRF